MCLTSQRRWDLFKEEMGMSIMGWQLQENSSNQIIYSSLEFEMERRQLQPYQLSCVFGTTAGQRQASSFAKNCPAVPLTLQYRQFLSPSAPIETGPPWEGVWVGKGKEDGEREWHSDVSFSNCVILYQKKRICMGCSDSKLVNGQEAHSAEKENSKAVRFLAQHDQVGESQPKMRETRCSDELNEGKSAPKSRGKDSEGKKAQSKEEKENILKVRKAKQLHNKPQIDKFISQILEGNRQTATPSPIALPEVKVAPTLAAKKATRWNTEVENPSKDYPNNAKQSAKTVEVKPQVSTSPKAAERVKAKTFMLEYDSQQSNQTLRL